MTLDAVVTPDSSCPQCGKRFDRASSVINDHARPSPGDFSLCIACGTVLRFTDDLSVRLATHDEVAALDPIHRAQVLYTQRVVRHFRERMN
jgi:hypothetical protein